MEIVMEIITIEIQLNDDEPDPGMELVQFVERWIRENPGPPSLEAGLGLLLFIRRWIEEQEAISGSGSPLRLELDWTDFHGARE